MDIRIVIHVFCSYPIDDMDIYYGNLIIMDLYMYITDTHTSRIPILHCGYPQGYSCIVKVNYLWRIGWISTAGSNILWMTGKAFTSSYGYPREFFHLGG